jgi:hypothetical protein
LTTYDSRQIFLPYCLDRLTDGRYIVLNRFYKPLGIASSEWVVYEEHPSVCVLKGLTELRAQKMSWRGESDLERIYFYNDGCVPTDSAENWKAYSARLDVFSKLTVDVKR